MAKLLSLWSLMTPVFLARHPRRRRFTLIELLVVIAIIAILAAMLLPALSKARQKSLQAVCGGNLKQQQLGFQLYMDNYDGFFPRERTNSTATQQRWFNQISEEIGDNQAVFRCPSGNPLQAFNESRLGYGFNWWYLGNEPGAFIKQIQVKNPTATVVVADSDGNLATDFVAVASTIYTLNVGGPHSNGTQILWVDGHVSWMRKEQIDLNSLLWDRN